jgi:hypothetical protein
LTNLRDMPRFTIPLKFEKMTILNLKEIIIYLNSIEGSKIYRNNWISDKSLSIITFIIVDTKKQVIMWNNFKHVLHRDVISKHMKFWLMKHSLEVYRFLVAKCQLCVLFEKELSYLKMKSLFVNSSNSYLMSGSLTSKLWVF